MQGRHCRLCLHAPTDRGQEPFRVLYVSGRPNWEYKFLNRAVAEDDQIQLVGLIRIAKREPKFDFRGRVGESSNPLFRGFGNQSKEEIERYDQPVLVRIYPNEEVKLREEVKLSGGFPKTAEELYDYHAVVLDDLESEFFTHDQMTLLQKFVSERGGGFLMLGGQESFHHGKYDRTPIGDMLPVYLDRIEEAKPSDTLKLSLTREGWLNPWVRLRNNETDENARLEAMPPFQVLNQVRDFKPGAPRHGTVFIQGTSTTANLVTVLPKLDEAAVNVRIVAVISPQLFALQDEAYRDSIASTAERWDAMCITNRSVRTMREWIANPVVAEYSLASDWDNRWRTGGSVDEVVDEAHLGPSHILDGIKRFAADRSVRLAKLRAAVDAASR
jgi:hypothetical protein